MTTDGRGRGRVATVPDFLGIGALKAGSTFLDGLLRQHPQVVLPRLKETNYFSSNFRLGPAWYDRQFPPPARRTGPAAPGTVVGEVCPTYATDSRAPARVHDVAPGVRLVMVLRHPVDRLVSQYGHWQQETAYAGSLVDYLEEHPLVVATSRYAECVAPWLERFGAAAFHFVLFEDLIADPVPVVQEVYRFVGVEDSFVPSDLVSGRNTTAPRRFAAAYAVAKGVARRLEGGGHGRLNTRLKSLGAQRLFRPQLERSGPDPAAGQRSQVPDWVRTSLRQDAERLRGLVPWDPVRRWDLDSSPSPT